MRLLKRNIDTSTGAGSVSLLPEEPEDMWHLYNLIRPLDVLRAPAVRQVKTESATGDTRKDKVRTTLSIRVQRLDFDPGSSELHVKGVVCEENKHVGMGSSHTLDLELHRNLTLIKGDAEDVQGGEGWDSVALAALQEATDVRKRAEAWAVVLQEGMANICIITEYQTILRQRVEVSIPRKRQGHGADSHDKGVEKFFQTVSETLWRHLDPKAMESEQEKQPPLLLASPGFTADALRKHILEKAQSAGDKMLAAYARNNVVVAHASSGHVHVLAEVLKQPQVMARLSDTKFAQQAKEVEKFFDLLREDDGRAWYGPGEVEKAVEKGAVGQGGGVLLLSDKLFRSQKINERRRWVALHDQVKDVEKGRVLVLSSAHESGKRLDGLGGVGAILTFPLDDLDEDDDDHDALNGHRTPDGVANGQNHDRIAEIEI